MEGRDHLGDLGIHRIILKWILKEIGYEDVDWIQLAQDRIEWQAVVNIIMNWVLLKAGKLLIS
jgi:hypothetical protein